MLSNEAEEDRTKIKTEIFDPIVAKYDAAKEKGDFSAFQRKIDDGEEVFMVSMLHYEGNVLCGIVSHGTPKIERYDAAIEKHNLRLLDSLEYAKSETLEAKLEEIFGK